MWCSLFIRSLNLPAGNYIQGTVYLGFILFFTISKPSSRGLSAGGYRLFIRLRTYFQVSKSVVQSVYKVSEPTCRELHPGDSLLGVHSFFLQFPNLPLYKQFIRLRTYFQGSKSGMQSVYKLGF